MILMVSDQYDQSTNDLIDWGCYYGQEVFVITNEDKVYLIDIDIVSFYFVISVKNRIISINDINYFIYRKGDINLNRNLKEYQDISSEEMKFLENELVILKDYLFLALQTKTKKYFGDYFKRYPNKLFYLSIAKAVGFKIPDTIITSSKSKLNKFYNKHKKSIISKAISEAYGDVKDGYLRYGYTYLVDILNINSSNETFFPSLFQNKINKVLELRVFFVYDLVYPMAMFFDNNENDYRDNYDKIDRMLPFRLPTKVFEKIINFIKKSQLTTGSIDIMLGFDYEYYFLEVNPNGQFGFVSESCNYHIEKTIIENLIS